MRESGLEYVCLNEHMNTYIFTLAQLAQFDWCISCKFDIPKENYVSHSLSEFKVLWRYLTPKQVSSSILSWVWSKFLSCSGRALYSWWLLSAAVCMLGTQMGFLYRVTLQRLLGTKT